MASTRTAMVALGGNALLAQGQQGTYEQQRANAGAMAISICAILDAGWRVVVVHGNGPQVGNLAIQQELGRGEVPRDAAVQPGRDDRGTAGVADRDRPVRAVCGRRHRIVALLSHVIVDLDDPAFDHPTKPIGPFFSEEAGHRLAEHRLGHQPKMPAAASAASSHPPAARDSSRSRRSRCLLDAGQVVVTGGGGGIPVGRRGDVWDGVDAVIDKDYAAAELAHQLQAEALVLITGVDAVQLDFGKPTQRRLTWMDSARGRAASRGGAVPGREHGAQGQRRRRGSSSVVSGRAAVITTPELVVNTLANQDPAEGSVGTRIVAAAVRHDRPDDTAADHRQEASA